MSSDRVRVLMKARALLAHGGWIKFDAANDINGDYTDPSCINAVCWCVGGAVEAAISRLKVDQLNRPGPLLADFSYWIDPLMLVAPDVLRAPREVEIHVYNDQFCQTESQALAWIDRALEIEQGGA